MQNHREFMNLAIAQARKSLHEGGVPIGAVLVEDGELIAQGHNRRVQSGDPIAHGEMDCLRRAGRRRSYARTTLYTTLSPCMMCAGTVVQFKIPQVVVGENRSFDGNIEFLQQRGVQVVLMDSQECVDLMRAFIKQNPDLWNEDISE